MSALDDRNRWIDHYHGCSTCGDTAGYCETGLDLIAAMEASMTPGENLPPLLERPHCGAQWPNLGPAGQLWTCTLDAGHDGFHEAYGLNGPCRDRSSVIPQGHEALFWP